MNNLVTIQEFRKLEPAFSSDQSVYRAIRETPGFPVVYVGRRVFVDRARWEAFKAGGGQRLGGGWRREALTA